MVMRQYLVLAIIVLIALSTLIAIFVLQQEEISVCRYDVYQPVYDSECTDPNGCKHIVYAKNVPENYKGIRACYYEVRSQLFGVEKK